MVGFSVIIPVFNVEKYLCKTINSILNQKYENLQIIIVDDGSTDHSADICDKYSEMDSRIQVIHQNNQGIVSARLRGIREANKDYIVCIDGDDWIEDGYFSEFSDHIMINNPDVLCCGYRINGEEEGIVSIPYSIKLYGKKEIRDELIPSLICDNKCKMFPKSLWAKAFRNNKNFAELFDIDPRINMGEDAAIVIPMIEIANSVEIIDSSHYCYRRNPNSLTKCISPLNWDNIRIWYQIITSRIDSSHEEFDAQINRYGAISVFYIATSQFVKGKKYKVVKENVKQELSNELFQKFISNAHFDLFCKQRLKIIVLKYNLFIFLKFFCSAFYNNRR